MKWQEHTEELYKKGLNDTDNHNSVVIHLKQDILECEIKWALGSISMNKAIDYLLGKGLNMPANLENSEVATEREKVSFHYSPKERQCQRMIKLSHSGTHLTC